MKLQYKGYEIGLPDIIIELKRLGNINAALNQAFEYGNLFQRKKYAWYFLRNVYLIKIFKERQLLEIEEILLTSNK